MTWILAAAVLLIITAGGAVAMRGGQRRPRAELETLAERHAALLSPDLEAGRPVAAIKALREAEPALGLADAKAVVDIAAARRNIG